MKYTAKEIENILNSSESENRLDSTITEVSIDSRSVTIPSRALFFALQGQMHDGHRFVEHAYKKGVRNFVVSLHDLDLKFPEANFYVVEDVQRALQLLATHHQRSYPGLTKIGITGSNGKTIIKEWLYQMLHDAYSIIKSPKSYNSQIGMALSLLGIEDRHELGIFEAGISEVGEMINHLEMLSPQVGLITNIGSAHDEGFDSREEKLREKMTLFCEVDILIYRLDDELIHRVVQDQFDHKSTLTWGESPNADLCIVESYIRDAERIITLSYLEEKASIRLRFTDKASFENCIHCVAILIHLNHSLEDIARRVQRISGLHMRMEMTAGKDQSILINDAYSADLDALQIALDFVGQQSGNRKKMAILGAFEQSGMEEQVVFDKIVEQLEGFGFEELIYISKNTFPVDNNSNVKVRFFADKEQCLEEIDSLNIERKAILIKGARNYELEEVGERLSEKGHSATLQIRLDALEHNLRAYKQCLKVGVGMIAVVKASAYGTGSAEVGQLLERNGVDYLAVAFADEGIALRQAGVSTRIMVFNPDLTSLPDVVRYRLEPEVYGLEQLRQIIHFSNQLQSPINIHLKLDSGMHRLGFLGEDITELCALLKSARNIKVATVFSHLASSEDEGDDAYSQSQFEAFDRMYAVIQSELDQSPKRHILNSGGISRFEERHYDFVRLGIGMYGIDNNTSMSTSLMKVHHLHAYLIQIKEVKKGDSIGYNRKTILQKDTKIGIVNIGYADGVLRNLGNRNYAFKIHGKEAPILGNVCMDVTIVDLNEVVNAKVGDPVVIFDDIHPIEDLASAGGTIPYEILSRISNRVNRTFVRE